MRSSMERSFSDTTLVAGYTGTLDFLVSLVLAAILIARWLLTVPNMIQLITDRRYTAAQLTSNGDGA